MTKQERKLKKDEKRKERTDLRQFRNLYSQSKRKKQLDECFGRTLWYSGYPTYSLKVSLPRRIIWRGSKRRDIRFEDVGGLRLFP